MTAKQRVLNTLEFKGNGYTPLLYLNRDTEKSDIVMIGYDAPTAFIPERSTVTEWGYEWESLDDTMGQPDKRPLSDWELWNDYEIPDPYAFGRFENAKKTVSQNKDKFLMGDLGITGFNKLTFLRGFENTLEDIYLEPERFAEALEAVIAFEMEIIKQFATLGVDGIAFGDDWGTQRSLIISPETFRQYFLPQYSKQFELVHRLGMKVYFHSCGYVYDIIPDMIAAGVDVFNLNQPDVFGVDCLGKEFSGKVTFCCPVDHQHMAITGSREEINVYAQNLKAHLGQKNGGFIGFIEFYPSLGMDDEHYFWIGEAFEKIRQ